MRTLALLRNDMRLHVRHGYAAAYAFVVVTYVGLLHALPATFRAVALPPVLLSETSVLAFFLAGTLLHLERGAGTLDALAMAPVRAGEYILSRTLSLSVLSAAATVLIALGSGIPSAPLLLLATSLPTTALFVMCGIAVAARLASLEKLVLLGGLGTTLAGLPVLGHLGWVQTPAWALLPTYPALLLFATATEPAGAGAGLSGTGIALALAALCVWCGLAFVVARRSLSGRTGWRSLP
jgi:fluoroquinolone transport system permease protein